MAHHKRKRKRTTRRRNNFKGLERRIGTELFEHVWLNNYPRWWDIVHHSRPTRREVKRLETKVLRGIDPENLVWPDGRKPHTYYW